MKVTLLLADAAQAVGGKLFILGGGWSNIMAPAPFAIAVKVEVPWNLATETHEFRLELVDEDGRAVAAETIDGSMQPVVVEGQFSTGIAPGTRQGIPMDAVASDQLPSAAAGPRPLRVPALHRRREQRGLDARVQSRKPAPSTRGIAAAIR